MSSARIMLAALYLEDGPALNPEHTDILTRLASKYKLRMIHDKDDARAVLAACGPSIALLVLDAGITRPENVDIANKLANLAWAGSTVVFAGAFCAAKEADLMRTLEKALGLPWTYGGRRREIAGLKRDVTGGMDLPGGYALEAVMMGNVESISVWYDASVSEKGAVVVFLGYGKGRLGYVGDVNLEESSKQCVMKMFEVAKE